MKRVLAIDVDGTLLMRGTPISIRTEKTLGQARKADYQIVLCTGRQYAGIRSLLEQLDLSGPHVVSDGAVIVNRSGFIYERHNLLQADIALAVQTASRYRCSPILWGDDDAACGAWNADIEYSVSHGDPVPLVDPDWTGSALGFHPTMALFVDHTESDSLDLLASDLDAIPGLSARRSGPGYVLAVSVGISKQSGLRAALSRTGFPRDSCEVIAFGDSMNDLPLFEESDFAVAMGGAHPSILAAADLVAPTIEEDGVAAVVEALLSGADLREAGGQPRPTRQPWI